MIWRNWSRTFTLTLIQSDAFVSFLFTWLLGRILAKNALSLFHALNLPWFSPVLQNATVNFELFCREFLLSLPMVLCRYVFILRSPLNDRSKTIWTIVLKLSERSLERSEISALNIVYFRNCTLKSGVQQLEFNSFLKSVPSQQGSTRIPETGIRKRWKYTKARFPENSFLESGRTPESYSQFQL